MNEVKVGDRVKCFVTVTNKNGKQKSYWAVGECYHIGETVLAFEGDNGHIYGVRKEAVELA